MRKITANYITSLIGLIVLNIVYFLWQPYPKAIIRLPLDIYGLLDIITNFIYFVSTYFVLVWIVLGISSTRDKQDKKTRAKNIFTEIGVIIVFEFILAGLNIGGKILFNEYVVFISDISMVIRWVFMWTFLLKRREKGLFNYKHKKNVYIIFSIVIAIILAIAVISSYVDINKMQYFINKYGSESEITAQNIRNIKFLSEVKFLILDALTSVITFSCVYLIVYKRSDDKIRKFTFTVRFILIIAAMFVVYWVKSIVFPHSLLGAADGFIHTSSKEKKSISINDDFISLYRVHGYNGLNLCYEVDVFYIYKGTKVIKKIVLPFNYASGSVETYKVDGIQVKIYPDYWLMFRDGGDFFLLELDEIKDQPENDVLIKTCEMKIEEGNFDYFEHGYEYLLKYDSDFIKPYIERYSNGDFTEEELELNKGINPEFIQELAKGIH